MMEELDEIPSCVTRDQKVLRLANLRRDAAKRCTYARVHHQAAQEASKLIEIRSMQVRHILIEAHIMFSIECFTRCESMKDLIEAGSYCDDNGDNGQCIEKC